MSTPTPSIPGVDRDALANAIVQNTRLDVWAAYDAAGAALAYIAAHHECACDREHDDEWVEVDEKTWDSLPDGALLRHEWVQGAAAKGRHFVHRDDLPDDLPDDPRALIARELGPAKADVFLGLLDEHGWTVTRKGER